MIRILLKITILFFLLMSTTLKAQEFQGKALYQTKIKISDEMKKRMESSEIPDDRKAFFKKMLKKRMEKVYVLDFNKTASTYKEEKTLGAPSETDRFNRSSNDILYKNTKENTFTNKKESFGKIFLIKDDLSSYDWKLGKESKMIGKHLCFKATALKEIKNNSPRFRGPPGRNGKEEKKDETTVSKEPKLTEITAWYSPEIPINHGPSDYYGLPGLILEVNAGQFQILCTKIVINPKEKVTIEASKKGKEINQKDYDEMMEVKIKELREQRDNNRKKGGQSGRRRPF